MAWFLLMKRPRHDLTWRGIRRKWAIAKEQPNNINGSIGNHHSKSPSAPLLNNNKFELLSGNVINVDGQSFLSVNEPDMQRSESVVEFSLLPATKMQHSNHYQDLSKISHSCDMEMICSELRIIISQLATLTHHAQREEEHEDESQDWKFVAMVIDRLFLILFIIFMALFTGLTLLSAPNLLTLR